MQKTPRFLIAAAAAATLALSACVTQPASPTAAAAPSTTATLGGALLNTVLANNGGASGVMSSLGVPASASAGNAAGVLTYCAKNNLLNADKAQQLTQQLLGQLTGTTAAKTQDAGYQNGLVGMIVAPNGQLFSLDQIKGNAKNKACDFVLDNAQKFVPQ